MESAKRLHKIGPTARYLGVTAAWLREEADAGRIPHLRAGDRLLFDVEAVEAVLIERATTRGEPSNEQS